jgi:hypothetical protein
MAMKKINVKVVSCFFLVCSTMAMVAYYSPVNFLANFYRYDRDNSFWIIFYTCLFVFGGLMSKGSLYGWKRTAVTGLISGFFSGLLSQLLVIAINEPQFSPEKIGSLMISLLIGTMLLLTPLWGILSFLTWKLLINSCVNEASGKASNPH